ncbi:LysR family transcriptional regulator [Pseudarthrobacter psychrotolerans]|uniref:LysR family transcriptional regulator n=1 Tax=Pseudarthrobacter psychrotolerans TaxID=2697569 RepID=A0A6P1NUZ8_9MICC|nr:LysR family transcriptional regulator [Pseudarthrobacter psychrotolerans]QHK20671.1 LysR family transcriptional regulator [Pseudarthrobacter psychrotolerans]
MDLELRHLRCLVGVAEAGTFTDAAIELGMSQAAVSRNIAALEHTLGVRLMRRTTRSIEFTAAGDRTVRHARRVLSIVEAIQQEAADGGGTVRIGYAWSALGRHTTEFQRRWADAFPNTELRLTRTNAPTAGLAEGTSDLAILRRVPDTAAISLVLIGLEKRFCAMAADDALAGKRSITLAEAASKPIALDRRTGSTRLDLWPEGQQPARTIATDDVDDWLTVIGSGKARGITAESTAHQYRRKGVVYRHVRDAAPVPVYVAWSKTDPPVGFQGVVELLAALYS